MTRHGKIAAVIEVEDLEAFEMAQDVDAYRRAKADDDGERVYQNGLRADLTS